MLASGRCACNDQAIFASIHCCQSRSRDQATRATQLLRVPHILRQPHVLGKVLTRISTFALLKVFDQWRSVTQETTESPLPTCTTVFSTTLRMPCAHVIKQDIDAGTQLDLDNFHQQWWLIDRITEEDSVSEANVNGHFRALEHTLEQSVFI